MRTLAVARLTPQVLFQHELIMFLMEDRASIDKAFTDISSKLPSTETPEKDDKAAKSRAELIAKEINRQSKWQVRMISLYGWAGPTPRTLTPDQQAY